MLLARTTGALLGELVAPILRHNAALGDGAGPLGAQEMPAFAAVMRPLSRMFELNVTLRQHHTARKTLLGASNPNPDLGRRLREWPM